MSRPSTRRGIFCSKSSRWATRARQHPSLEQTMINSINQVIHATTNAAGSSGTARARAAPAAPAARAARAARASYSRRERREQCHDARRHRFSHPHAGAAEESGPDQSRRQQRVLEPARLAERGAGHHTAQHLVRHPVQLAHVQPGTPSLVTPRPSSLGAERDGHPADGRRGDFGSGERAADQLSGGPQHHQQRRRPGAVDQSRRASRPASRTSPGTGRPQAARHPPAHTT